MEEASNNVINNYKGVMLCSRPNEQKSNPVEKPFCARVVNSDQLGIAPAKNEFQNHSKPKKRKGTILAKHKKWLAEFQGTMQQTKLKSEEQQKEEQQKMRKIKEQAEQDRERAKKMKEEFSNTANKVLNVLEDKPKQVSNELTADNLKKLDRQNEEAGQEPKQPKNAFKRLKERPAWSYTKKEMEEKEEEEVEGLINFFQSTPVNQYSQDEEVKQILKNLKEKIDKLRQEEDWKQKEATRIETKKQEKQREEGVEDDKYSNFSVRTDGKSVASEKSQRKIEELRAKQAQQEEWDRNTTSQKSSAANLEDRIAKNLADEVLRSYPNLKGIHSNTSIRKLLEAEASRAMNEPILRPVISTIVREKQPMNANTLPYMHRNPAI